MQYTYHVRISTEAGASISNAVTALSASQNEAKQQFKEVTSFLAGEEFGSHMIETLGDHLQKFEREQQDENLNAYFIPIMRSLQEVKAGIVVLMDLKEGSFLDVLDSFRVATESLGKDGKIEDSVFKLYENFIEKFQTNKDKQLKEIMQEFLKKDPLFKKSKDSNFVRSDEDSEGFYTDKFKGRMIGDKENVFKGFETVLARNIVQEFISVLDSVHPKKGSELFSRLLEGGDKNPALKKLQDLIRVLNRSEEIIDEIKEDPKKDTKTGKISSKAAILGLDAYVALMKDDVWDNLSDELTKGIKAKIKDNKILNTEVGNEMIEFMVTEIVDAMKPDIIKSAVKNNKSPSLPRGFIKGKKDEESLIKSVTASLTESRTDEGSNDRFKLNKLFDSLQGILTDSQRIAIAEEGGSEGLTKLFIKDNLSVKGFDELLSNTMSEYLTDIFSDNDNELLKQLQTVFDFLEVEVSEDFFKEKLQDNIVALKGVFDTLEQMVEESKKKMRNNRSAGVKGINTREEKDKPDFNMYFEEAVNDRQDKNQQLYNFISDRFGELTDLVMKLENNAGNAATQTLNRLDNLLNIVPSLSEEISASASQIRRRL